MCFHFKTFLFLMSGIIIIHYYQENEKKKPGKPSVLSYLSICLAIYLLAAKGESVTHTTFLFLHLFLQEFTSLLDNPVIYIISWLLRVRDIQKERETFGATPIVKT